MMISKQEVRLGNMVRVKENLVEMEVIAIDDIPQLSIVSGGAAVKQVFWHDLTGILLTEEILKKYGFYHEPMNGYYHKAGLVLGKEENGFFMMQRQQPVGSKLIKYLHELQNLYYFLTGHELINGADSSNFAEYRIDNEIYSDHKVCQMSFVGWDKYKAVNALNKGREYSDAFMNIPLEDDLMERLGFVLNGFFTHPLLPGLAVNREGDGYYLRTEYGGYVNRKPILVVSHLQNLVSVLTGIELSLDLK